MLEDSKLGVQMEKIIITVLGFADDVMLITDDPSKLQALLDICGIWSYQNDMSFNISKCKVLVLNAKLKVFLFNY